MLRRHDVVLAPSIRAASGDDEGGPALTLVMAQAAGKPVIASDFPGIERSVTSGVEGLIVPAGDVAALHDAMLALDCDVERWRAFGAAGRVRAIRDFSDANSLGIPVVILCAARGRRRVKTTLLSRFVQGGVLSMARLVAGARRGPRFWA